MVAGQLHPMRIFDESKPAQAPVFWSGVGLPRGDEPSAPTRQALLLRPLLPSGSRASRKSALHRACQRLRRPGHTLAKRFTVRVIVGVATGGCYRSDPCTRANAWAFA
jgi:hypothetical protein